MKTKIVIIGSGAMGTAIASLISNSNQAELIIYGVDADELNQLKNGMNTKYFPKKTNLPKFYVSHNLNEALTDANFVVLAVPSIFIPDVIFELKNNLKNPVILINVAKGFYPNSDLTLFQGIQKAFQNYPLVNDVVSILGPGHAEDIVKKAYMALAIITDNHNLANRVKKLFSTNYCKLYWQNDLIGADVGCAYKNILAIIAGILQTKGYSINTTAAVLTMGMHEAQKLNQFLGGKNSTLLGLTGLGDLLVTAFSPLSRNYQFGCQFAQNISEALNTKVTVEGLHALKSLRTYSLNHSLNLLVVEIFYQVIYDRLSFETFLEVIWSKVHLESGMN